MGTVSLPAWPWLARKPTPAVRCCECSPMGIVT